MSRASAKRLRQRRKTAQSSKANERSKLWSDNVTRHSNALDLEPSVFTWEEPADIARSLKQSAEASGRRKSTPYQSAMSMLTFYINRAGRNLPDQRRKTLEQAKVELRKLFGHA